MEFICPRCRGVSMKITSNIDLPPDSRSDEVSIQIIKCSKCGFAGLGIHEETRRGKLDSESVNHRGYYLDDSTLASLEKRISNAQSQRNLVANAESIALWVAQTNLADGTGLRK